jgi:phosphatidylserine/phosphatidylglycerophosphate/cardiolipin synthase-like enzyme
MQLQAHFHDIQGAITRHLKAAQDEILAAVAWFTDREIFDVLCQQAQAGIRVSIAVLADDMNQAPGALNFRRLCSLGGKVAFLPPGSDGEPMMHHKFCVLDGHTVITGSYNWSKKARRNDENITVVAEAPEFAAKYRQAFHDLLVRAGQAGEGASLESDAEAAGRCLEMVRNLILLGEQEDLLRNLVKLRAVAQALQLQPIMQSLERGAYREAKLSGNYERDQCTHVD